MQDNPELCLQLLEKKKIFCEAATGRRGGHFKLRIDYAKGM